VSVRRSSPKPKKLTKKLTFKDILIQNLEDNGYTPIRNLADELFPDENEKYISKEVRSKKVGEYYYKVTGFGLDYRGGYEIHGSDSISGPWTLVESNWG
jgi:hypothetical protein